MLLSSFPLTLVVEADGTDSSAASTGKKFKGLFTMSTVQNIYKVTMQGGQGSRDGLVGKVLCIYIYIYTQVQGKGEGKDSTRSPLLPLTLALLHNPRHSSKQTLQMGSGTGPGNLHTKREQVQTNSNSPTIQPQEAQSHQLQ